MYIRAHRYQFYDTRINHFGGRNARAGEFRSKRDLRRATSTNLRLINGHEFLVEIETVTVVCFAVDLNNFGSGSRTIYSNKFFATEITFFVRSIRRNK